MGEEGEARRLGSGVLQGEGCYGGCNVCSLQTEVGLQGVRRLLDLQARQPEVAMEGARRLYDLQPRQTKVGLQGVLRLLVL